MKKLLPGLALFGILLGGAFFVQAETVESLPSAPLGFVSDYANLLSEEARAQIEAELVDLEKTTGAEVAVVTVQDLGGVSVEEFAVDLFEKWGIGKEKEDNGLLFLVAQDDRKVRIEVGYGLEGVITDGTSGAILDQYVIPSFRNEDYGAGIVSGTFEISRIVRGGTPPVPLEDDGEDMAGVFGFFFVMLFNTGFFLLGFMARSRSFWFGGVLGAVVGILFSLVVGYYYLFVPLYAVAGLLLDFLLSRYASHWTNGRGGGPGSFWTGGGSGGRGGGGFGGFGGGSSGGGGASRSW